MSLATPIAIRTLQRKLYRKAKAEPNLPLLPALRQDLPRGHSASRLRVGPGQMRARRAWTERPFTAIEAPGLEKWLAGLREELVSKVYYHATI